MTRFLRVLFGLRRALFGAAKGPSAGAGGGGDTGGARPGEGRATADPWLAGILGHLGERYRLGGGGAARTRVERAGARAEPPPIRGSPASSATSASAIGWARRDRTGRGCCAAPA